MSTIAARRRAPAWTSAIGATDHKTLGRNLFIAAFAFFIVGGVLALIMRLELAAPGMQFVSHDTYNELFTMHGSTMIYLFVTPLAIALGVYLVPLQIGAADISAPRLANVGFWLYITGGLTLESGFLTAEGPGKSGWFATWPLSTSGATPGTGMDLWVLGVILSALGMIALGVCLLGTIMRRRAPGMTLLRMPPFTWTQLVTALMVIGAFPVLVLVMTLLYLDRQGVHIFNGFEGAIDYQNLFWFYGHPVVYVMFFPFVGCALEAIATNAGRRLFGYKLFALSLLLFTALSMSVWAHHMYTTGGVTNRYFAFTSTALLVPAGIEYFDMIGTLIGGAIIFRTSLLFGVAFFLQFLVGGASGIFVASPTLDYHAHDGYFVIAHFHYTLFAGSIFGFFAGAYHWFPKAFGVRLREGLGKLHLVLLIIGTNLTFFPMFFLGQGGMPRRVATYPRSTGWETLNTVETVGAFIIALAIAVFLWNVVVSLRSHVAAGPDPWDGQSLEWATSSPPPRLNFDVLPPVRSYAPLLDLKKTGEWPRGRELEEAPA
jgi:cytochrome c oxidase subunit I